MPRIYDANDYDLIIDKMTNEESIALLQQVSGYLPSCQYTGEPDDFEICKLHEVIYKAISVLKEQNIERSSRYYGGGWISVDERLPEEGEKVLVWYEYFRYGEYNCMFQTYGIGYQFGGYWGGDVNGANARCIAWMPLPLKYEPKEDLLCQD